MSDIVQSFNNITPNSMRRMPKTVTPRARFDKKLKLFAKTQEHNGPFVALL